MLPKIELPIFDDGSNPHDWLGEMEKFWVIGQFREEEKMDVVTLLVEGRIKQWYDPVLRRGGFRNWQDFKQQFVIRFTESIDAEPSSIKQSGSVLDSRSESAELSSPIASLTDSPVDKLIYHDLGHEMKEEAKVEHDNTFKSGTIFPEVAYEISGYELEMMEASTQDSMNEAEDVLVNRADTSPLDLRAGARAAVEMFTGGDNDIQVVQPNSGEHDGSSFCHTSTKNWVTPNEMDTFLLQQLYMYNSLSQAHSDTEMVPSSLVAIWEEEYARPGLYVAFIPPDPGKSFAADVLKPMTRYIGIENMQVGDQIAGTRSEFCASVKVSLNFLDSGIGGSWMITTMIECSDYRPPSQFFYNTSSWGSFFQDGLIFVECPLVDRNFYANKTVGVMFELAHLTAHALPNVYQRISITYIDMLVESSTVIAVSYLLFYAKLPSPRQLVDGVLGCLFFYPDANPALKGPAIYKSKYVRDKQIVSILGQAPTIAAAASLRMAGRLPILPLDSIPYAENFLYMLDSVSNASFKPNPCLVQVMKILFRLHAEHERNRFTAAGHLASSGVEVYNNVAGAIGALYSPLHEVVQDKQKKMSGVGHYVYKNYDPRAQIIKKLADAAFSIIGKDPLIKAEPADVLATGPIATCDLALLVKWMEKQLMEDSWLSPKEFINHFPTYKLEGKLGFNGRSIDRYQQSYFRKRKKESKGAESEDMNKGKWAEEAKVIGGKTRFKAEPWKELEGFGFRRVSLQY